MKKKILLVVTLLFAFFTVASCVKQKETLATPQNVKVSSTGLVTWDVVEHAEKYSVIYENDNDSSNADVTENQYQLEDTSVNWNITVIAKASKYNNSESSEVVEFTPADQKEVSDLIDNLIDTFLGEKDPNLTPELAAQYDSYTKYFKEVAKKAVKLGYKEEVADEIVEMISEPKDMFGMLTSALNVLNLYSEEQVVSTLYAIEIGVVGQLINIRQMLVAYEPSLVDLVDQVIVALQDADVDLVEHLYSILGTAKSLVSSLTPIIAQISDVVNQFEAGTLTAKTVYDIKSTLVKALKVNAIAKEDLVYIFDFVIGLNDALSTALDLFLSSGLEYIKEFIDIDVDIDALVEMYGGTIKNLVASLGELDAEELATNVQNSYMAVIDFVDDIKEEYIDTVLSRENLIEMLVHVAVDVIQSVLPEASEIGKVDAEETIALINVILKQIIGENCPSITELFGITEEQIADYVNASADFEESIYECFYNIIHAEGIKDAIINAMHFSSAMNEFTSQYQSFTVVDGVIDYDTVPEFAIEFLEKYDITSFDFDYGYSEMNYHIVEPIVSTENSASFVIKNITFETYGYDYLDEEVTVYAFYSEQRVEVSNASDLVPLIQICVNEFVKCEDDLLVLVNTLISFISNITMPEGTLPEEVAMIFAMVSQLEDKQFDKLVGLVFDLLVKAADYVETIDVNKLVLMLSHTEYLVFSEIQALVKGFGTSENIKLMKDLINEVANAIEKLDLFETIGYESKEEFVSQINNVIDDFFK